MNDRIQVSAAVLHHVADQHDEVADEIDAARTAGADIHAAVSSYGPIMHQVKAAVADLLAEREAALSATHDKHRDTAETLRRTASGYASVDEQNAERLRLDR